MELIIVIVSLVILLFKFFKPVISAKIDTAIVSFMIVLTAVHFAVQGPRWQMYVEYLFIAFYLVIIITSMRGKSFRRRTGNIVRGGWLVLILFTAALLFLFPYNKMPEPYGEYPVGTFSFDAVDPDRAEFYGDSHGSPRRIRLQFWYPAAEVKGFKKDLWLSDGAAVARMIPAFTGMPGFIMEYTARIESNSYRDAPILTPQDQYPVVVLSHGWLGFRNLHSDYAELLASNGYIAVSIDHTYGSLATVFDNGTAAVLDSEALPLSSNPRFSEYADRLVTTYSYDTGLVLDLLSQLDEGTPENTTIIDPGFFAGSLDTEAIGLIGHSTGGGGIVRLAINDPRVKAAFGLDPWVDPVDSSMLAKGLVIPSVLLRSGQWAFHKNNKHLEILKQNSRAETLIYQLKGSSHLDFSMMYMFEPVTKLFGYAGTLDSSRSGEIQRDLILRFFDCTLKSSGDGFLDFAGLYPEIVKVSF